MALDYAAETRLIHGPSPVKKDVHGALRTPIYANAAFAYETAAELREVFQDRQPGHVYSRSSNPTVEAFTERLQYLTGARGVLAFSSGMAAILNTLLFINSPNNTPLTKPSESTGANLVCSKYIFGNTYDLLAQTLPRWGLTTRFVDIRDLQAVSEAISPTTQAIFLESIANPQLYVADLAKIVELAHQRARPLPVILDGTLTTPLVCDSRALGVDLEILSSTKYISGGGTAIGGVVIDNGHYDFMRYYGRDFLATLQHEIALQTGSCLAPEIAYLHTLGLETLALRIKASFANALSVAEFLVAAVKKYPQVLRKVHYPGLPTSPAYPLAAKQFKLGFGGIVGLELATADLGYQFMDQLKLVKRATNMNDNKSLIIHPASTIYHSYSQEQLADLEIGEGLLRLSVGIENLADIVNDLQQALASL